MGATKKFLFASVLFVPVFVSVLVACHSDRPEVVLRLARRRKKSRGKCPKAGYQTTLLPGKLPAPIHVVGELSPIQGVVVHLNFFPLTHEIF